jgi:hypothetical protein
MCVVVKEIQDETDFQNDACFVVRSIALFKVLVMTNELHLGEYINHVITKFMGQY